MDQLTSKSRTICPELAASTRRQADLRQVHRTPLHQSWYRRISGYSSTSRRRPRRIVFTNIARGHHRRQPSTSTNSITSLPSQTVVIVNANKIFFSY
jgi:hypothetical protein